MNSLSGNNPFKGNMRKVEELNEARTVKYDDFMKKVKDGDKITFTPGADDKPLEVEVDMEDDEDDDGNEIEVPFINAGDGPEKLEDWTHLIIKWNKKDVRVK